MILPKLSAALLSMSLFGSAYAVPDIDFDRETSLDQWVVISGAANGAASAFGASAEDVDQHRNTAFSHLMRYAQEQGFQLAEFDSLFERGQVEGRKLAETHRGLIAPSGTNLIDGFMHDKAIEYQNVKKALDA
ncbi:hypothetical protein [Eoetvoesiella caeni]|uniref:Host cell surface-exposed lipoprotein n=1 Tax=Eoetvoesiella caeni TaxID=645616 RepID=A0A366HAY8_9BURK|nr:hypothetical protein [Eoetvoesiella caeni]MCI2809193.1 hypothetical protein [Eoetvoesiella caeni]NYT54335.1 hypothetical protein [Eoetvoesiella caeni]RBP39480.1 hypothetical protein DFR37_105276 [Eoetvoesiella caeni]